MKERFVYLDEEEEEARDEDLGDYDLSKEHDRNVDEIDQRLDR